MSPFANLPNQSLTNLRSQIKGQVSQVLCIAPELERALSFARSIAATLPSSSSVDGQVGVVLVGLWRNTKLRKRPQRQQFLLLRVSRTVRSLFPPPFMGTTLRVCTLSVQKRVVLPLASHEFESTDTTLRAHQQTKVGYRASGG